MQFSLPCARFSLDNCGFLAAARAGDTICEMHSHGLHHLGPVPATQLGPKIALKTQSHDSHFTDGIMVELSTRRMPAQRFVRVTWGPQSRKIVVSGIVSRLWVAHSAHVVIGAQRWDDAIVMIEIAQLRDQNRPAWPQTRPACSSMCALSGAMPKTTGPVVKSEIFAAWSRGVNTRGRVFSSGLLPGCVAPCRVPGDRRITSS